MKEFARGFYKSKAWKDCREAYTRAARGLCEVCLAKGIYTPGVIVHHVRHLDAENISDPAVTLDWGNLQLVCRECHAQLHSSGGKMRFTVDEMGRVTAR